MKRHILRESLASTLAAMKEQTGLEPGAPTMLCHAVLLGALRPDAVIDFRTHSALDGDGQERIEQQSNMFRVRVSTVGGDPERGASGRFLGDVLRLQAPQYDAIVVAGQVAIGDLRGEHGIAVVKNDDEPGRLMVVDSLSRGAFAEGGADEVAGYIDERFDGSTRWFLMVDKATAQPQFGKPRPVDIDSAGVLTAHVLPLLPLEMPQFGTITS